MRSKRCACLPPGRSAASSQLRGHVHGTWRSLVSAPALGAGGRRFKSGRPDQNHERPAQRGAGVLGLPPGPRPPTRSALPSGQARALPYGATDTTREARHGRGDGGDRPPPHPLLGARAGRRGGGAAAPRQPHHRQVLAGRGRRVPRRLPAGRAGPARLRPHRAQAGRRHQGAAGLERRPARPGRGARLGRRRSGPPGRLVQRRRGGPAVRHRPRRRACQPDPGGAAVAVRVRRQPRRAGHALLGRLGRQRRRHGRARVRAPPGRRRRLRGGPGLQPPGRDAVVLLVAGLQGARRGRAAGRGAADRRRRQRLPGGREPPRRTGRGWRRAAGG